MDLKLLYVKQRQMSFLCFHSSFTTKDHHFRAAIEEAITAFNNMLQDFGYTQKLEIYDPHMDQVHPPQQHSLFH